MEWWRSMGNGCSSLGEAAQRVCMKGISQSGLVAGDKSHSLGQVVFAQGGLEVGE
jgi:hypothetical protein